MPFQQIDILRWRLAIDPHATTRAYERLAVGCDCAYCRNFLAVQAQLPKQVQLTLQLLGVDPIKPAEIVEYAQNPDSSHLYSCWYHAVGQILADCHTGSDGDESVQLTPEIAVTITAKADLAAADFPRPVLQIELFSNLRWVLAERPDKADKA